MKGYRWDLDRWEEVFVFLWFFKKYEYRAFGEKTCTSYFVPKKKKSRSISFRPTGNRPEERGYGAVQSIEN